MAENPTLERGTRLRSNMLTAAVKAARREMAHHAGAIVEECVTDDARPILGVGLDVIDALVGMARGGAPKVIGDVVLVPVQQVKEWEDFQNRHNRLEHDAAELRQERDEARAELAQAWPKANAARTQLGSALGYDNEGTLDSLWDLVTAAAGRIDGLMRQSDQDRRARDRAQREWADAQSEIQRLSRQLSVDQDQHVMALYSANHDAHEFVDGVQTALGDAYAPESPEDLVACVKRVKQERDEAISEGMEACRRAETLRVERDAARDQSGPGKTFEMAGRLQEIGKLLARDHALLSGETEVDTLKRVLKERKEAVEELHEIGDYLAEFCRLEDQGRMDALKRLVRTLKGIEKIVKDREA